MTIEKTAIEDLVIINPTLFEDSRGYFFEAYNQAKFQENGIKYPFIQDNQSFSIKGVVRGLHFQKAPFAQGKLVRVVQGEVFDVASLSVLAASHSKAIASLSSFSALVRWMLSLNLIALSVASAVATRASASCSESSFT